MILVYDGNNVAYRSNAVLDLYTKSGKRTSAIFGTLHSIKKDIEYLEKTTKVDVESVIFVWDSGRSKRRLELYPNYKGDRDKKREADEESIKWHREFIAQINYLHEVLPNFGVNSVKVKDWEADDLVYVITKLLPKDRDIVVVSADEDYFQLIQDNVTIFSPIRKELYNNKNFLMKVGVPVNQFVLYKCLVGDKSDNIDGIRGIGPKTAASLISDYGSKIGILKSKVQLSKSNKTKAIFDNWDIIERNEKLIDLKLVDYSDILTEVTLSLSMDVSCDTRRVREILKENQFVSMLTSFNQFISPFEGLKSLSS